MVTSKQNPVAIREERRELKRAAKEVQAILQSDVLLNALDAVSEDRGARNAAVANPKKWLRQHKLTLPRGAVVTIEERPLARLRIVGFCVTVCITRKGYTVCATSCRRVGGPVSV